MPEVEASGIEIHDEVYGEEEPLVLLAGLVGFGASWGPQIPLFAEDFLTIVPDHRGTGRSSVSDGPYTIEDHARDMPGCGGQSVAGLSTSQAPRRGVPSRKSLRSSIRMFLFSTPDPFS